MASGFLNQLERPMEVCQVALSSGAPFVTRCSSYRKDLPQLIQAALRFEGFALMDIWGVCPGRFMRGNRLTPKMIEERLGELPSLEGPVKENVPMEYGQHYRELAARTPAPPPP